MTHRSPELCSGVKPSLGKRTVPEWSGGDELRIISDIRMSEIISIRAYVSASCRAPARLL